MSIDEIINHVAGRYGYEPMRLVSPERDAGVTQARSVALYVLRKFTVFPLATVAAAFGRSQASVLYAVRRIEQEQAKDKALAERIAILAEELKGQAVQQSALAEARTVLVGALAAKAETDAAKPKQADGPDADVTTAAGLVRDYMREEEWHYHEEEADGRIILTGHVSTEEAIIDTYFFRLVIKPGTLQMVWYLPTHVVKKRRPAMAEFCAWVNHGMVYGVLVMDPKDGELSFKLCVPSASLKGDAEQEIDRLFGLPLAMLEKYTPGVISVLQGEAPEEAYEACERTEYDDADEDSGEDGADDGAKDMGKDVKPALPAKADKPGKNDGGHASTPSTESVPKDYSIEGLNVQGKVPLEKIVAAVRKFRDGKENPAVDTPRLNILLSGAPGSGKTSFVKYLAHEAGMPLRTVRASDLLSCLAGATEHKIAEVFREAGKKGEMLFLDEIDSFLQDRAGATHSWEVTQVNELLQQMEAFGGVMVGATNFAENLDKAVLRRFTYKLKLDYLTDEGKGVFFKRYFKTPLTAEEKVRLNAIGNLTPGDFRTVREELFYLSDRQTNAERLEALEAESAAKGIGSPGKIGF